MFKKTLWAMMWSFNLTLAAVAVADTELEGTLKAQQNPENLQPNIATLTASKTCEACYLVGADLHHLDLRNANLNSANLQRANLAGADLTAADLSGADLREANLQGAKLANALLVNTLLYKANLQDAQLPEMSQEMLQELISEPPPEPIEGERGIRG
jgi:uncharacterized protein YjbI with pentapeptide repeats